MMTFACLIVLQYASEEAELLLVGNKLDCETDRIITKQQAERVRPAAQDRHTDTQTHRHTDRLRVIVVVVVFNYS